MLIPARTSSERTRGERLEARITAEQKTLIQRAAELEGRSVTDYVIASVQEAARRTVEAHQTTILILSLIQPTYGTQTCVQAR